MEILQGKGIAKGAVTGKLAFKKEVRMHVPRCQAEDPSFEKKRLHEAMEKCIGQLELLISRCKSRGQEEASELFAAHLMLAKDEYYVNGVEGCLMETHCNAEFAVWETGEQFASMFDAMEDEYMKERAADVRDVSGRILRNLQNPSAENDSDVESKPDENGEEPVILVVKDLSPSDVMEIDKKRVCGLLIREGSSNGHAAILARTMGIPAVCRLGALLDCACEGQLVSVNGESGRVFLDPDDSIVAQMEAINAREKEAEASLLEMRNLEDETADGRKMPICCNVGSLADVPQVLLNGGRGIGLFRTEFLFLASHGFPDEEEQFQVYRELAVTMEGKPVVIRTLDLGADKQADFLSGQEENPALGMRGIRLCLERPELFYTQLRALYRASAYGKISILFPMIASVWEVLECKRICGEVMKELDREKIPYRKETELGVMIETPASVLIAEELAKEVDFFSVGTNDLIQYTLACDRQATGLGKYCDSRHPAVMRSLAMAADAAKKAGIRIAICGELARDTDLLPMFLSMGITELSVPPCDVLALRAKLHEM